MSRNGETRNDASFIYHVNTNVVTISVTRMVVIAIVVIVIVIVVNNEQSTQKAIFNEISKEMTQ